MLAAMLCAGNPLAAAAAQPATVETATGNGFGRMVLTFSDLLHIPAFETRVSSGILVLQFSEPVDISIEAIPSALADYVTIARRDPDGMAVRFGLARAVTVNTLVAGEKLFVDFLPADWSGLPPGLPSEVVADLARRAEEALRQIQAAQMLGRGAIMDAEVALRVGRSPTFVRFSFRWNVPFAARFERTGDTVAVTFNHLARLDLSAVRADPPPLLRDLVAIEGDDGLQVVLTIDPSAEVRAFRDDGAYVIDLTSDALRAAAEHHGGAAAALPGHESEDEVVHAPGVAAPGDAAASARLVAALAPTAGPVPATATAGRGADPAAHGPDPAGHLPAAIAEPAPDHRVADHPAAGAPAHGPDAVVAPGPAHDVAAAHATQPTISPGPRPASQAGAGHALEGPELLGPRGLADDPVVPAVSDVGQAARIDFAFPAPVAAAIFARGTALWLVFDSEAEIDLGALRGALGDRVLAVEDASANAARIIRIRLAEPALIAARREGSAWSVAIGEAGLPPPGRLAFERVVRADGRGLLTVTVPGLSRLHELRDPDFGDRLLVATSLGPADAVLAAQRFTELALAPTAHGLVVAPLADDIAMTRDGDTLSIARPAGLALSTGERHAGTTHGRSAREGFVDLAAWGRVPPEAFSATVDSLKAAVQNAADYDRPQKRIELAAFLLARQCGLESLGLLKLAAEEDATLLGRPGFATMVAAANVVGGRFADATRLLSADAFAGDPDAAVWRTLAADGLGDFATAHSVAPLAGPVVPDYPAFVQQRFLIAAARASLEQGDPAGASAHLAALSRLPVPGDLAPWRDIIGGRLSALAGRSSESEQAFNRAIASPVSPAASEARLHLVRTRYESGAIEPAAAIGELEGLTTGWRGDATELTALGFLADLAAESHDYRAAFQAMRSALVADPNSDLTHAIQRRMEAVFAGLYLEDSHGLPPIEALALYYDFREMTPVGRRGDAMVRKLADRLLDVDLVDQAAELLTHQVDERLTGAARAQVAADLAVIHLIEGDPRRALQVLRRTDQAELSGIVERQRRLVEARAMAATGEARPALELLGAMTGSDVDRLRVDILWSAGDWRGVGAEVERIHAGRWSTPLPLADQERRDVMLAAMAYVRAEDEFGLERLRARFGAKMADSPDARAFDTVTRPLGGSGADFDDLVRSIAAVDTLDAFVADYRRRYFAAPELDATPTAALPARRG